MASLTGRSGDNMSGRFAFGFGAVMTAGTATGDAGMVHRRTFEAGGRLMASLTGRSGDNMGGRFAFGFGAVMTAGTATGDAGMVHRRTFEAGG